MPMLTKALVGVGGGGFLKYIKIIFFYILKIIFDISISK